MPETKKKPRKPRAKRAPAKKSKKGLKQKQKQRQEVNVNVSAGGSGGGGYVPIPQAPSVDYGLISQLLKPAATVDMPIRAAAPVPELPSVRPAEPPSLVEEVKPKRKYTKKPKTEIPAGRAAFMAEFTKPQEEVMREKKKRETKSEKQARLAEEARLAELERTVDLYSERSSGNAGFQNPELVRGFGEKE